MTHSPRHPHKIVHLTSVHQPFDTRIFYKECVSLAQTGYDVVLVAPYDHSKFVNGVKIRSVPKVKGKKERIRKTIWQVYLAAIDEEGDIYHFHDPELIPIGFLLKLRGKKVIFDIHEDVPAQILEKEYINPAWLRTVVSKGVRFLEWMSGVFFDGIISVVPKITEKFPKNKSITLQNYPILQLIDQVTPASVPKRKPAMIYAGGITKIRSAVEIIKAINKIDEQAELWLLGKWETEDLKKSCEILPGWRQVQYFGFKSLEETYGHLKSADIGLIIFYPLTNHLIASPNKAFEYMACSLPMIMSDFPYWREVFEGAAIFVDPQNPDTIADAMTDLLEHPEKAKTLGAAGRRMVEEKYSWEAESQKLFAFYEKILDADKISGN